MSERAPFERLMQRHRAEIAAYLRRLMGDAHEAEDVAQDTWLRAHRAFGRLPADANTRAWLYRIATNRARTALRKRSGSVRRTSTVELDALPGRRVDPTDALMVRAVARAVGRLPAK